MRPFPLLNPSRCPLPFAFLFFLLTFLAASAQPQYHGNPLQNYPPWVTQLTYFGQRADWSHDGKKLLFIEKTNGVHYIDI